MMCLCSFINYNIYHSGGGVGNGDNALVGARNIWEIFVAENFLELLTFYYYILILFSSLRSPFLVILVGLLLPGKLLTHPSILNNSLVG